METKIEEILRHNNLSVTDSRKKILNIFLTHASAIAHRDIEKKAGEKFDRVTVYRTLQTFVEKGIIHTIPTTDNSVRYALCRAECTDGHHHDDHVHFICLVCGNATCMEDVSVPGVELPRGYTKQAVEVVVKGICKNCRQ
jgi:Fur family transcriptional regulator, ferric uptake regulator